MTEERVKALNDFGRDLVPGLFGIEITRVGPEGAEGGLIVTPPLIAGTGFLFAPVVVSLADILCAFSMNDHLPADASFTTVEMKTNFLSSAKLGEHVVGRARPAHIGRTTHVWDAEITNASTGRTMALFRNTQLILLGR